MSHTKDKWTVDINSRLIIKSGITYIAYLVPHYDDKGGEKEGEANAKRICQEHNSFVKLIDLAHFVRNSLRSKVDKMSTVEKLLFKRAESAIAQAEE